MFEFIPNHKYPGGQFDNTYNCERELRRAIAKQTQVDRDLLKQQPDR